MKKRDTPKEAEPSPAPSRGVQPRRRKRLQCCLAAIIVSVFGANLCAAVTLPLQAYCHANRYMPVRVDNDAVEFRTSDSISTLAAAGLPRVVPVLIGAVADELVTANSQIKLNLLRDDERLVAIGGRVGEADAKQLFTDAPTMTLPLDESIFSSPPAAWQALDGMVLDAADAVKLDDSRRSAFLAAGITLAVGSPDKPDARWPWARRGTLWILRSSPVGPGDELVNSDAFGPITAIPPGLSSRDRRTFGAVTLVLLAMLIAARFVRWPLRYLLGVVILSIAFTVGWRHARPAVASGQGDVIVQSNTLQRQDAWLYEVGRVERIHSVPWSGFTRPVLPSDSVLSAARLELVDDGVLRFEYHTMPGRCVAFVRSDIFNKATITSDNTASPMQTLANDAYVQPSVSVIGSHRSGLAWPSTILQDDR